MINDIKTNKCDACGTARKQAVRVAQKKVYVFKSIDPLVNVVSYVLEDLQVRACVRACVRANAQDATRRDNSQCPTVDVPLSVCAIFSSSESLSRALLVHFVDSCGLNLFVCCVPVCACVCNKTKTNNTQTRMHVHACALGTHKHACMCMHVRLA
jgi:hypothetical protein